MKSSLMRLGLVLIAAGTLAAETVTWVPERDIDCPVVVALDDEAMSRSVVFPEGGRITSINAEWLDASRIQIRVVRNALEIRLRDPGYQAAVVAYDDRGNIYTLSVHAHDRDEPLDQRLIVVPPAPVYSKKPFPVDTDQGTVVLMRHMVGGERSPEVQESPITRSEGDRIVTGEILPSSSRDLTVMRTRFFQAPGLKGYTYQYTWRGQQPMRLDMQSVWPVGARWVSAVGAVLYPDGRTELVLQPNRPITVCYVGWVTSPTGK